MIGVVLAAPAAIRAAAPAARLPFATRLALRDLARYQARAAAALAAITLAISISVAVVGIAGANVHGADEGNMSSRAADDPGAAVTGRPSIPASARRTGQARCRCGEGRGHDRRPETGSRSTSRSAHTSRTIRRPGILSPSDGR